MGARGCFFKGGEKILVLLIGKQRFNGKVTLPSVFEVRKTVITLKAGTVISFSPLPLFPRGQAWAFSFQGSIFINQF